MAPFFYEMPAVPSARTERQERARAEQERARAERLAARLRDLGVTED